MCLNYKIKLTQDWLDYLQELTGQATISPVFPKSLKIELGNGESWEGEVG